MSQHTTWNLQPERTHCLVPGLSGRSASETARNTGPVLYWMHRDHRVHDNWGLLHAQYEAMQRTLPLAVVHCLAPAFLEAAPEHFAFLNIALDGMQAELKALGIPLARLSGDPGREVAAFAGQCRASMIFTDFDPLRRKRAWIARVCDECPCPVVEVDSRNIVPCRRASDKQEYMARTFRPKVMRGLMEYLEAFPAPLSHPHVWSQPLPRQSSGPSLPALPAHFPEPGEQAARRALDEFIAMRLSRYEKRNDPNADAVSGLSPYLHFGMLSAQRAVLAVSSAGKAAANRELPRMRSTNTSMGSWESVDGFIEQIVVRRELSDNYCFHNPDYDNLNGAPQWARRTLDAHRDDPREAIYDMETFARARTHDPLWNAAQLQLLHSGTIHGYMRMYWGKKILEWSATPEDAYAVAVMLNDRHALDGRETNGYTGIAWSVAGVHDRPWKERPVFGQIRYMNDRGAKRKFDTAAYILRMERLAGK